MPILDGALRKILENRRPVPEDSMYILLLTHMQRCRHVIAQALRGISWSLILAIRSDFVSTPRSIGGCPPPPFLIDRVTCPHKEFGGSNADRFERRAGHPGIGMIQVKSRLSSSSQMLP